MDSQGNREGSQNMNETATEPEGTVHKLSVEDNSKTICGMNATSWPREVTQLQKMGLVVFCDKCKEASS